MLSDSVVRDTNYRRVKDIEIDKILMQKNGSFIEEGRIFIKVFFQKTRSGIKACIKIDKTTSGLHV